ncbi:MAG: glycerophosphodiester phosphodiesterase [Candidatus Helarchaeota archaeon]
MDEFIIIAHRGASGYELENSYAAFEKAIKLKADMIETDIHETYDGYLILMHDGKIDRTTFGSGKIKKLTIQQIKNVKMKNNDPIPVLDDVLKKYNKKIGFNLEIKSKNIETKISDIIVKYELIDSILISCFSYKTLKKLRLINPRLRLALLTFLPTNLLPFKSFLKHLKSIKIDAVNPFYKFISKKYVKKLHENDIKIYPWTVNNKETILKLKNQVEVDGIITNFPDILS